MEEDEKLWPEITCDIVPNLEGYYTKTKYPKLSARKVRKLLMKIVVFLKQILNWGSVSIYYEYPQDLGILSENSSKYFQTCERPRKTLHIFPFGTKCRCHHM